MDTKDPLESLIVDAANLDRERLSSVLNGYLGLSKIGGIVLLPNYSGLDTKSKLLGILLAQRAACALGLTTVNSLAPKQIELMSGIPGGTIRRELAELASKRLLINNNGVYSVPDYAINNINLATSDSQKPNNLRSAKRVKRMVAKPINTQSDNGEIGNIDKLLLIDKEQINRSYVDLMLKPGLYLERALAVLKIARDNDIESLTPTEITTFLKEKMRAGGVRRENISLALGRGTRYVDRYPDPKSGGYKYKIMVPGDELLEGAANENNNEARKR